MKRFVFTLARLKQYKERMLEAEKNTLGVLRRELMVLRHQLADILDEIFNKNNELAAKMQQGTTPIEIAAGKRFITVRKHDAHLKQNEILAKEDEVQLQLEAVLELQREFSSLEKLEEAQLEEYRAAELKEHEIFIDEFITNADFRRQGKA
ncbi:MAG: flagellar FliJ family protein [Oscillospiraceae bacterium]|nr:flagellar FliJ family protein [Oscillospiraceae bacterium]